MHFTGQKFADLTTFSTSGVILDALKFKRRRDFFLMCLCFCEEHNQQETVVRLSWETPSVNDEADVSACKAHALNK